MTESNGSPIGPTVGAGLGAVGGAGYNFDPDQIAALIPKWEALKDELQADLNELRNASYNVSPPTADPAAASNARATQESFSAAIEHNLHILDYAQKWVDKLREASGAYVQQDAETGAGLNNPGSASGGGLYQ